jgi:hypothetical protein
MNLNKLINQQAVINFIGKNTGVKFKCSVGGILHYETVLPKYINEEYCHFEVSVFHNSSEDFLDFETLEDVCYKRQVFELKLISNKTTGRNTLYHQKYINPNK